MVIAEITECRKLFRIERHLCRLSKWRVDSVDNETLIGLWSFWRQNVSPLFWHEGPLCMKRKFILYFLLCDIKITFNIGGLVHVGFWNVVWFEVRLSARRSVYICEKPCRTGRTSILSDTSSLMIYLFSFLRSSFFFCWFLSYFVRFWEQ